MKWRYLSRFDVLGASWTVLRHTKSNFQPCQHRGCPPSFHRHGRCFPEQTKLLSVAFLRQRRPRSRIDAVGALVTSAPAARVVRCLSMPRTGEHSENRDEETALWAKKVLHTSCEGTNTSKLTLYSVDSSSLSKVAK